MMTFWGLAQTERKCVITNRPTSGYTRRHTESLSSHAHFMASLHPATPSPGCLLSSLPALFVPSLPLFLWVTLTRAWGGEEEEVEGRQGGHTKERPMGVSTTPDCGFCTLSLLTAGQDFLRDFSSYFDCLSPGKYYVTRLFDWLGAHFHSPVSCPESHWQSVVRIMFEGIVRCVLSNACACCVVTDSEQQSWCYPTLSRVDGMQENNDKHTHIHTRKPKRWSESGRREGGESHHFLQKGKMSWQQKFKTTR